MDTSYNKSQAQRKYSLKIKGERMQAMVIYNRTLMSSALSAQLLITALERASLYGSVHSLPYYRYSNKGGERTSFKPGMHNDPVDLYLVGVEGWYDELHDFIALESVRSITLIPISAADARDFCFEVIQARESGHLPKGVGIELVCDISSNNLVATVAQWCCKQGWVSPEEEIVTMPVQGYTRFSMGKSTMDKTNLDNTELVEVYYKYALEASDMNSTGSYAELLETSKKQIECLHVLLSGGFDVWLKEGLALVQKAHDELTGNLLMATISKERVVFAPNSKDGAYIIGYLLRKKYPECRAVVLYHKLSWNNKYVYRVLRGAVQCSGNIFTILADATREGKGQASISSELTPRTVQRIADAGMRAIINKHQKGYK